MIDFTKYNRYQLQAIVEVLDALTDDLISSDITESLSIPMREYRRAVVAEREAEMLEAEQARDAAEPAGDPPAPPDMFGWVGDALDDLCAAGEVIGNDR